MSIKTTSTKRSTHHKKLKGDHHRHSKHYLRAYHPFLPMLLLVVIGLAIASFWPSKTDVLGASSNLSANALLQSTNTERARHQADDLILNQTLSMAAQSKAQDMVDRNYWSHDTPDGKTPWHFIKNAGYEYNSAAENLAYGFANASATVTGWMNSKEHRSNLINPAYQEVGFGTVTAQDYRGEGPTTVIVALYAQPSAVAGFSSGNSTGVLGTSSTTSQATVSRIQVATGGSAPWSFVAVSAAMVIVIGLFVFRHARFWHRALVKGERFVVHHKALDVVVITFTAAGYVLTRAAGYIH